MERVELLVSLDQQMGANVPDSVASEIYTVRDLVDAVIAHSGASHSTLRGGLGRRDQRTTRGVERATIDHDHPIIAPIYFFGLRLILLMLRDLFKLQVEGIDKLPKSGPFILSPNHQSFVDGPVVIACLPWQILRDTF